MVYPQVRAGQRATAGLLTSMLPITVTKTVDEQRASTVTMANDSVLTTPVAAGATYQVFAYVVYSQNLAASSTSGINLGWSGPTGSTFRWTSGGTSGPANLTTQDVTAGDITATRGQPSNLGTFMAAIPAGLLVVGGTAGTFALQWAQVASSATATIVRAGSYLRLFRVS